MELWQMDVMGGVLLDDGAECKVITGIDDHSRFCVIATVVARATTKPTCDAMLNGLSGHGAPEQILTHNDKLFTGRLARRPATVAFDRISLHNGNRPFTGPLFRRQGSRPQRLHGRPTRGRGTGIRDS